jgi:hypothetical protein
VWIIFAILRLQLFLCLVVIQSCCAATNTRQHIAAEQRHYLSSCCHPDLVAVFVVVVVVIISSQCFVMESPALRFCKDVGAGTVAGVAVCLVGHPFDTLKVRLQTQSIRNPVYSGTWDCFTKTVKWEGISGLYKGVGSPLVGQMFFRAVMFSGTLAFCCHTHHSPI